MQQRSYELSSHFDSLKVYCDCVRPACF